VVRRFFYLKYSLSNMSVAERRRGWPAWDRSLSNGTGTRIQISQCLCAQTPLVREARQQQSRDPPTAPSEGGQTLGPCLGGPPTVPSSKRRCAEDSPTHRDMNSQCDNYFSRLFLRKRIGEDRRQGQGDQRPSPSQAGPSSLRGSVSTLRPVLLRL
jgi:hypothetical protein